MTPDIEAAANAAETNLGRFRKSKKSLDIAYDGPPFQELEPGAGTTVVASLESQCKWPHGQGAAFRFCGAARQYPSDVRKPYCENHNKLAYSGPWKRRRA